MLGGRRRLSGYRTAGRAEVAAGRAPNVTTPSRLIRWSTPPCRNRWRSPDAGITRHLAVAGIPCSMSRVRFVPVQSFVFEADSTRTVITSVSWYWLWRTDEA